jgi:aryl-alcohol dehydrogenase-like predicted oxidoreductase
MQNQLNLINREEEREMLPLCAAEGIGVIPWSPMARGRLTRDWAEASKRSDTDLVAKEMYTATEASDRLVAERVKQVAEARGVPRAQVALAWVLQKSMVTAPIIGAAKFSHVDDAVQALKVRLTREELALLESAYVPHPVAGFN